MPLSILEFQWYVDASVVDMVGILKRSLVNTFARFSSLRKEKRDGTF